MNSSHVYNMKSAAFYLFKTSEQLENQVELYFTKRLMCFIKLTWFQTKAWCLGCREDVVNKFTKNNNWNLGKFECEYYGSSCIDYVKANKIISEFKNTGVAKSYISHMEIFYKYSQQLVDALKTATSTTILSVIY